MYINILSLSLLVTLLQGNIKRGKSSLLFYDPEYTFYRFSNVEKFQLLIVHKSH